MPRASEKPIKELRESKRNRDTRELGAIPNSISPFEEGERANEPVPAWVPEWVPCPVRKSAIWKASKLAETANQRTSKIRSSDRELVYEPKEQLEILKRVTSDERMKSVWRELYKTKTNATGRNHTFLHPARINDDETDLDAKTRQDYAVEMFFRLILKNALTPSIYIASDLTNVIATLSDTEKTLNKLASRLMLSGVDVRGLKSTVVECQDRIEELKDRLARNDPGLIKRRTKSGREKPREHDRVRNFIGRIGRVAITFFGGPLYATVATITNVALRPATDVGPDDVRDSVRRRKTEK